MALLDFDVHHGNGTEACVAATAPSLRSFNFKTPFSEGSQTFPVFSPWLDTDDADNILFARWVLHESLQELQHGHIVPTLHCMSMLKCRVWESTVHCVCTLQDLLHTW